MQSFVSENIKVIKNLYDVGFSLVPSNVWNADGKQKVPYSGWKRISERLNPLELMDLMDKHRADSIAVLAGKLSGNLFIIDIDTKYKEGIDAKIFKDISEWYPEIAKKIRIEKTPSGGYHLLYRINLEDREFPSFSGVIAGRIATDEELEKKPGTKGYGFIEQKNICQCYPTKGYSLVRDWNLSLGSLSWSEHSSILNLCKDYDERPEKINTWVKPSRNDTDLYEESPWVSFNVGIDCDCVLDKYGEWRRRSDKENSERVYFIKPGKPKEYKEDGAVYLKNKGYYVIYTTSGGIDDGAYSPVSLLLKLKFGGDKKMCFQWLVSNGYGIIKKTIEKSIIKKSLSSGKELPANISKEGKIEYGIEIEKRGSNWEYGVFWDIAETGSDWRINREKLYEVSEKLGFCINNSDICYISIDFVGTSSVIEIVSERFYFDSLKRYIGNCDDSVKNCYESFIQNNGKFSITRLKELDLSRVLVSTKEISYKAYLNGIVRVSSAGWELISWSQIENKLVWRHQIQERNFVNCDEEFAMQGLYWKFLDKAFVSGAGEYIRKIIGYYAHDYKSTNTPYIAVLCEVCDNPKNGGGSGKNVFTNLFRLTSSVLNKPAKGIKYDDTFLRTWKNQKIVSINDAEKKFDYLGLREMSSGEGEVGKKYIQEITIANKDMPKLIVNTNFAFNPFQPGLKRRLISAEMTEFFIKCGGIDVYFGVEFPSDPDSEHGWTEKDFIGYDWVVLKGIQEFIASGCKLKSHPLTDGGWIKQFEQEFNKPTLDFIKENIEFWLELENVRIVDRFNIDYDSFCKENRISIQFQIGPIKMNEALAEYCEHNGIEFKPHKNMGKGIDGKQVNAKVFKKIEGFEKKNQNLEEPFENDSELEEPPF